jgi:hypothetical protein
MRSSLRALATATFLAFALIATGARADALKVTPDVNPAPAGFTVTFTISPAVMNAGDVVNFTFGDGGTGTITYSIGCQLFGGCATITHAYAGPGTFTITATGTISGHSVTGSVQLTVTPSASDTDLYIATGAHRAGFNNTTWRTDVWVKNTGTSLAHYSIGVLARDTDNSAPDTRTFTLDQGHSATFADILDSVFGFSGAAALRVAPVDGKIIVTSRTYNQLAAGTYSQFVPAVPRAQAVAYGYDAYLIGLSHDPSLQQGFRTNIGLVSASPAPITLVLDFFDADGIHLGTIQAALSPFEFVQLDRAFEQVTTGVVASGSVVVSTLTAGGKFFAYASVVDNITGDPNYVPAQIAP